MPEQAGEMSISCRQ